MAKKNCLLTGCSAWLDPCSRHNHQWNERVQNQERHRQCVRYNDQPTRPITARKQTLNGLFDSTFDESLVPLRCLRTVRLRGLLADAQEECVVDGMQL